MAWCNMGCPIQVARRWQSIAVEKQRSNTPLLWRTATYSGGLHQKITCHWLHKIFTRVNRTLLCRLQHVACQNTVVNCYNTASCYLEYARGQNSDSWSKAHEIKETITCRRIGLLLFGIRIEYEEYWRRRNQQNRSYAGILFSISSMTLSTTEGCDS